jgi:DNA-binding GntR family transcriptional regulator
MQNSVFEAFKPLEAEGPLLSRMVEAAIETAIMSGRLGEGATLVETDLAAALHVSRSPVRDALKRLAHKGLIEPRSKRGYSIATFSYDQVADLLNLREVLEGLAARLAAERMTDEDIADVRRHLDAVDRAVAATPDRAYPEDDEDFHARIHRGARARELESTMAPVHTRFRLLRRRIRTTVSRGPEATAEHRAVLTAIEHRDPEQAEAVMRAHIRMARSSFLAVLHSAEQGVRGQADHMGAPGGGRE